MLYFLNFPSATLLSLSVYSSLFLRSFWLKLNIEGRKKATISELVAFPQLHHPQHFQRVSLLFFCFSCLSKLHKYIYICICKYTFFFLFVFNIVIIIIISLQAIIHNDCFSFFFFCVCALTEERVAL